MAVVPAEDPDRILAVHTKKEHPVATRIAPPQPLTRPDPVPPRAATRPPTRKTPAKRARSASAARKAVGAARTRVTRARGRTSAPAPAPEPEQNIYIDAECVACGRWVGSHDEKAIAACAQRIDALLRRGRS